MLKDNKGYTLVELLLVIAIISIIASLSIMSYRRYYREQRSERVAIEMQHVLEAALAYNVDYNAWPNANNVTPNCMPADPGHDVFIKNYLPNARPNSYTNSLGGNYCWSEVKSADEQIQGRAHLFWLAVKVPKGEYSMAARISAKLPNAIMTSDPLNDSSHPPACIAEGGDCYVRTEVVQPSQTSAAQASTSVVAVGDCKSRQTVDNEMGGQCKPAGVKGMPMYTVTFPACASGVPSIVVIPNDYHPPLKRYPYDLTKIESTDSGTKLCSKEPDSNHQEHCTIGFTMSVCHGGYCEKSSHDIDIAALGGSEKASYIVSCVNATRG